MEKLLLVSPHCSTGGAPKYLLKRIEVLNNDFNIYFVEWQNLSDHYVVQKTQIKEILKDKFYTLGENKAEILKIIEKIKPDIVHFEEFPETFIDQDLLIKICSSDQYKICETTHGTQFNKEEKLIKADKTLFVSPNNLYQYITLTSDFDVVEYPIYTNDLKNQIKKELNLNPEAKHVLNVGLFTPGKNQGEIFEYARRLEKEGFDIEFHFVGNQADNFKDYWQPLMDKKPQNCTIWGERNDVYKFYLACDLFLFTSKLENKPLVLLEAQNYRIPTLAHYLSNYGDSYKNSEVEFLTSDFEYNLKLIKEKLGIEEKTKEKKISQPPEIKNSKISEIKCCHLLTKPFEDREQASLRSLTKLVDYGFEYQPYLNKPYTDLPPKENCAHPEKIGLTPGNTLTPGHYGCYLAHRDAILDSIKENRDCFIVFECDCVLDCSHEEFRKAVDRATELIEQEDLLMFSFGFHNNQGIIDRKPNTDYYIVSHFIGAHAYLIPKKSYPIFEQTYCNKPWNVSDLFFIENFSQYKTGIFKKPITKQARGVSILDKVLHEERF